MDLSNKLKALRQEKNLSANQIASLLGITRRAYSYYEQGSRQPDYDALVKLAVFYNVTTDYLLGLEDYDYCLEYQHNNTKLIHKEKTKK